MIVKDVQLTILKIENKSGKAKKSGNAYSFYVATAVDEDANVFQFTLKDELTKDAKEETIANYLEMRNVEVSATLSFVQRGFNISGSLVDFDTV